MDPEKRRPDPFERRAGPYELWQGGLTLTDALDRFADGQSWSRCKSRVMDRFDHFRTDPRSPLSDRVEATARLQDMARAWEEQARLLEDLRAHLIGQLHAGELMALGFTVEPASSSKLAIVPREEWANAIAIDWDQSGVRGKDTAFLDVRVLPPRKPKLRHSGQGTPPEINGDGTNDH